MDRIQAMQALLHVVSEGSFTKAAERLETSPQLISKYIAQLETHLNTRLLNRTTRKVHLTEAGYRYVEHARQIINDIDDMESQLVNLQEEASGTLKITAPVSFSCLHMAQPIVAFQTQHPKVSVDLQLNDRKVDILEEGYDIALRIGQLSDSSLIARRITEIRLVICAAPSYLEQHGTPQHIEALNHHRLLHYSYMEENHLLQNHHNNTQKKQTTFVSNNGDLLTAAAIAGAGIVIQPTFIAGAAIAAGHLQRILIDHEPEPVSLYIMYAHRKLLASKVRSFIDFMEAYFGEPAYWDEALT